MSFISRLKSIDFGKVIFFRICYIGIKIADIYFGVFFIHNRFISEAYFETTNRFRNAAVKVATIRSNPSNL